MARHKTAQNCAVLPWMSRRQNNSEGRFLQVGNSLLLSSTNEAGEEQNPFVRLSAGAKYLYICMAMEAGGKRKFEFTRTAAKKYGICSSTLRRNIDELIDAGFIIRDSGWTVREPNRYSFSYQWKGQQ